MLEGRDSEAAWPGVRVPPGPACRRPVGLVPQGRPKRAAATTEQAAEGEASPGAAAEVGGGEAAAHRVAPPRLQPRARGGAGLCCPHPCPGPGRAGVRGAPGSRASDLCSLSLIALSSQMAGEGRPFGTKPGLRDALGAAPDTCGGSVHSGFGDDIYYLFCVVAPLDGRSGKSLPWNVGKAAVTATEAP